MGQIDDLVNAFAAAYDTSKQSALANGGTDLPAIRVRARRAGVAAVQARLASRRVPIEEQVHKILTRYIVDIRDVDDATELLAALTDRPAEPLEKFEELPAAGQEGA
jgi:hypothetical protein